MNRLTRHIAPVLPGFGVVVQRGRRLQPTMPTSQPRIYHDEAWHGVRPVRSKLRAFVSSASHQVGMAAVAATWPTSGVRVALLPAWRAKAANWAELITAAPPGSLLK